MPETFERLLRDLPGCAITYGDRRYSPDELRAAVDDFAAQLDARITSRSPFVHLFAPNHPKFLTAFLGLLKSGRICVLLDPAIGRLEHEEICRETQPAARIRPDAKSRELAILPSEIEDLPPPPEEWSPGNHPATCAVLYTAAEDGIQKGVELSLENLLPCAASVAANGPLTASSISCALLPFDHSFGIQAGVLAPMMAGGTTHIMDLGDLIQAERVVDEISRQKVTHLFSVPLTYWLFSRVEDAREKLAGVGSFQSGGAKLPEEVFHAFLNRVGAGVREGYGLTEAAPVCAADPPGGEPRVGSVGPRAVHCELEIRGHCGSALPAGEVGEVCVRGPNVMQGYLKNPQATAQAIRGGWLRTGDFGYLDPAGYLYLTGLKKRMLLVGGRNVYPTEVERFIAQHPNVEAVEVFGEDDPVQGHIVKARAKLKVDSLKERIAVKAWCLKNFSRYKVPRAFEPLA